MFNCNTAADGRAEYIAWMEAEAKRCSKFMDDDHTELPKKEQTYEGYLVYRERCSK